MQLFVMVSAQVAVLVVVVVELILHLFNWELAQFVQKSGGLCKDAKNVYMHKSNAVPIRRDNKSAAIDIAAMRR